MTNDTSGDRTAASGTTQPAWLCPMSPMREASMRESPLMKSTAATRSPACSVMWSVALEYSPPDFPTPRLSNLRTAKPR